MSLKKQTGLVSSQKLISRFKPKLNMQLFPQYLTEQKSDLSFIKKQSSMIQRQKMYLKHIGYIQICLQTSDLRQTELNNKIRQLQQINHELNFKSEQLNIKLLKSQQENNKSFTIIEELKKLHMQQQIQINCLKTELQYQKDFSSKTVVRIPRKLKKIPLRKSEVLNNEISIQQNQTGQNERFNFSNEIFYKTEDKNKQILSIDTLQEIQQIQDDKKQVQLKGSKKIIKQQNPQNPQIIQAKKILQKQLIELKKQNERLKEEKSRQFQEYEKQKQNNMKRIRLYQIQTKQLRTKKNQLQKDAQKSNQYKTKINKLTQNQQKLANLVTDKQNKINTIQKQLLTNKDKLTKFQILNKQLALKCEQKIKQIQSIQLRYKQDTHKYLQQIQELTNNVHQLATIINKRKPSQDQDSQTCEIPKVIIEQLKCEITNLNTKNNELLQKMQNIQELQEKVQQLQNQIKQTQNQNKKFSSLNLTLKSTINEFQIQINKLKLAVQNITLKNEQLSNLLTKQRVNKQQLFKKLQECQSNLSKTKIQLNSLQGQHQSLKQDKQMHVKTIDAIIRQLTKNKQYFQKHDQQIIQYKTKIQESQVTIQQLSSKIKELEKQKNYISQKLNEFSQRQFVTVFTQILDSDQISLDYQLKTLNQNFQYLSKASQSQNDQTLRTFKDQFQRVVRQKVNEYSIVIQNLQEEKLINNHLKEQVANIKRQNQQIKEFLVSKQNQFNEQLQDKQQQISHILDKIKELQQKIEQSNGKQKSWNDKSLLYKDRIEQLQKFIQQNQQYLLPQAMSNYSKSLKSSIQQEFYEQVQLCPIEQILLQKQKDTIKQIDELVHHKLLQQKVEINNSISEEIVKQGQEEAADQNNQDNCFNENVDLQNYIMEREDHVQKEDGNEQYQYDEQEVF